MEFNELIQKRRSIRSFEAGCKVTKEQMEELVCAAQMAPTWKNSQCGRYYAICSDELLADFRKNCLPDFNQNSSANAALIVATFVKDLSGFSNGVADNELGNMWGTYDLGCQNAYLVLKASDMGLDTLIMGIRDNDKIREMLQIPEEEEIVAVIAVGCRTADPQCPKRKDLSEVLKIY